ncbi:MAG: methyltransferase domain-containing protein [Thermomicrobiales bacterium]|nr:methyltransferase domain-containing protein [Thermomicrobiales bacterium]
MSSSSIHLRLDVADLEALPPRPRDGWTRQTVPLFQLPLAGKVGTRSFVTGTNAIPLRSGSVDSIELGPLLEFILDEATLVRECARVLRAGGILRGCVPNARGFGAFDSINVMRYARDVIGRGPALPELAESGWRRHYAGGEVASLLHESGFEEIEIASVGLLGSEMKMGWHLLGRWVRGSTEPLNRPRSQSWPEGGMPAPANWTIGSTLLFQARKTSQ